MGGRRRLAGENNLDLGVGVVAIRVIHSRTPVVLWQRFLQRSQSSVFGFVPISVYGPFRQHCLALGIF